MLKGKIHMNPQEREGGLNFFDVKPYMTTNFQMTFGDDAILIMSIAISLVMKAHPNGADYFQSFYYETPDQIVIKFWLILDETKEGEKNILTALLPSDY
jgi:hypothetical protein